MKLGLPLGIVVAVVLHLGFLLFGGALLPGAMEDQGILQEVELLSPEQAAEEEEKPEDDPDQDDLKQAENMEDIDEEPPDASEIIRSFEQTLTPDLHSLQELSLSAIEQALSGQIGVAGDFASSVSLIGGGRIGGTGSIAAVAEESIEAAFSLAEIDQQPRAIIKTAPLYPAELRSKKLEGIVTLIFIVDAAGKVTTPRVERSTHPAFEKPALDAVRQWKFEPGLRGGQRVDCPVRVPIRFQPS